MLLRTIDRILTRQALITASVRDALDERPPATPPEVALFYPPAAGEDARPYPLTARSYPGGLFVFAGDPTTAFPALEPGDALDLRLVVRAPGYQDAVLDFSLDAEAVTPVETSRHLDGRDVTVLLVEAPVAHHDVALTPEPVFLSGRVVDADAPDDPVAGASVAVTAPPGPGTTTDADGFFTLEMPVVAEATLTVSHADFDELTESIRLDYRQPVNRRSFSLNRAAP